MEFVGCHEGVVVLDWRLLGSLRWKILIAARELWFLVRCQLDREVVMGLDWREWHVIDCRAAEEIRFDRR